MIPVAFEYQRAGTVEEALALKQQANGDARFVAGGHSLIPLMKLRLIEPTLLIDVSRIPGLSAVEAAGDRISIGALTTHADLEVDPVLLASAPIVAEAAGEIGDQQVRNRGTIGGSLAHADPASDLPAVMVALDTTIHATGSGGERTIAAEEFFRGLFDVDLADDEMITSVNFDATSTAAYAKLRHRASHFRDRRCRCLARSRGWHLHLGAGRRHRCLDTCATAQRRRGSAGRCGTRRDHDHGRRRTCAGVADRCQRGPGRF